MVISDANVSVTSNLTQVKRYGKMWWLRLGFPDDDVRPTETTAKNVIIMTGELRELAMGR